MVLSVGRILLNFCQDCFCPCNTIVVFEVYSLIGSLVINNGCGTDALMGMLACMLWTCYGLQDRPKNDLHAFEMDCAHFNCTYIHCTCFICQVTWSLMRVGSTCNMFCRHYDEPTNGPMGNPHMVRLP